MEANVRFLKDLEEAKEGRRAPLLFGILNVTPDSFSDGGALLDEASLTAKIDALLAEGADVIDIGGESTRPGASPVDAQEELGRVLPAIRIAHARGASISIDTQKAIVAQAALDAGATIVNDVSCLADLSLAPIIARYGAAYVLMHSRTRAKKDVAAANGTHEAMQTFGAYPEDGYRNITEEVIGEWRVRAEVALAAGVAKNALIMDPGLGFAKSAKQSATLVRELKVIVRAVGVPVLVGASRKSFLTQVDREAPPQERLGASIAVAIAAADQGALLLRVHDVRATAQALAWRRLIALENDGQPSQGAAHA